MKHILTILISIVMSLTSSAQTYDALWKQVKASIEKDAPRTTLALLDKISEKAKREKEYGHYLKALKEQYDVYEDISSDSLSAFKERIGNIDSLLQKEDVAASWLLRLVMYDKMPLAPHIPESIQNIYSYKSYSGKSLVAELLGNDSICSLLTAKNSAKRFYPLIECNKFTEENFNNDLISIIANMLNDFKPLAEYYSKKGMRQAACICTSKYILQETSERGYSKEYAEELLAKTDSALNQYSDIKEGAQLANAKYAIMERLARFESDRNKAAGMRYKCLTELIAQWGKYDTVNPLRDELDKITAARYEISSNAEIAYPVEHQILTASIRNIKDLTVTATPVEGMSDKQMEKINKIADLKPYLKTGKAKTVTYHYEGHEPYEEFQDSIDLGNLPVGIYWLQMKADGKVLGDSYELLCISNLRVIALKQTDNQVRYVVVKADTGKPVPGATLYLENWDEKTKVFTTDDNGEYLYNSTEAMSYARATTKDDQAQRMWGLWTNYNDEGKRKNETTARIYTDRSIYRPGQKVHASFVVYSVDGNNETKAEAGKSITVVLQDASYKKQASAEVVTDEFGVAAIDFDLPKTGLNGTWCIYVAKSSERTNFRVEEYVRPTFDVEISQPEIAYANGDTIKITGKAKAYSGAPVMNAKVTYKVNRRPVWWFRINRYHDIIDKLNESIYEGNITTKGDGSFEMSVPMTLPELDGPFMPLFCNIHVEATVTDIAGETHSAFLSLPLGNSKAFMSCNLSDHILADNPVRYKINRYNNAGKEIEGKVSICIDGKECGTHDANKEISLPESLASGKHKLVATCEGDTLEHSFVMFRMTDKVPATDTKDWWYQSKYNFGEENNDTVHVQFGTIEKDIYAVYSILSGSRVIESGSMKLDSSLITREFIYKPEYGNGISFSVAWVRNGKMYSHTATIKKCLPSKKLEMKWATFRNRLVPGQKEEWKLSVTDKNGKAVSANVMATLYDKSLDAIKQHGWSFPDVRYLYVTYAQWCHQSIDIYESIGLQHFNTRKAPDMGSFPEVVNLGFRKSFMGERKLYKSMSVGSAKARGNAMDGEVLMAKEAVSKDFAVGYQAPMAMNDSDNNGDNGNDNKNNTDNNDNISIRENLSETAFFMPQLRTNDDGIATLSFTLPESVTTWKFIAFVHDKEMRNSMMEDEAIAQKDIMIQPRLPRFVREGDKVSLPASIANLSDKDLSVKAKLTLLDAETEKVVLSDTRKIMVKAGETGAVFFSFDSKDLGGKMLICRMTAEGGKHTDGEQHYLPVLSAKECVMDTRTMIIKDAGVTSINVGEMIPATASDARLTVEYTDAPEWLLVQSLPYVTETSDDNAISLVAAFFTNNAAASIAKTNPKIKETVKAWGDDAEAMKSALSKNDDLRQIVLSETPWMLDADNETERKSMLYRLFDENMLQYRNNDILQRLSALQNADGSWSWWKGMSGSHFITEEVLKTLLRLNRLTGEEHGKSLISRSFSYLDNEVSKEVKEMKKAEKKGNKAYITDLQLNYLYCHAISTVKVSSTAKANIDYLLPLVKEATSKTDMLSKAMTSIIFNKYGKTADASEYIESICQHTVYREDMGRYFDSKRARYSWFDYKIPTQVMTIEALKAITNDQKTISEMQRWLLQSKRTQAWDTPINAVNAIYAFLGGKNSQTLHDGIAPAMTLDKRQLNVSEATKALGYVKTSENVKSGNHSLTIEKKSKGESWANIYMQYTVPSADMTYASTGIKVERIISTKNSKVGDKVTVTIKITADRDYDFVTVTDNRSACLEPVNQLSGYRSGCYQVMKDSQSQYHYDMLSKGTHEIKTEYYVTREGEYASGTVSAQCAYAPEFCGREKGMTMKVDK